MHSIGSYFIYFAPNPASSQDVCPQFLSDIELCYEKKIGNSCIVRKGDIR